jgi:DNA-binding SARP family transcriptional activator/tetratricopeptide (TPR) repeat protein
MTPSSQEAPGSPDRPIEILVLGAITVRLAGQRIPLGDAKHRLMLAMLVAAEGRQISTAQLISQIWGDGAPRTARDLVYSYASDLRGNLARGLGGATQMLPRHRGGGYRLVAGRSDVDLYMFRDLSSRARSLAGTDPGQAVALWRQALALWGTGTRGDPGDGPFIDLTASAVADCQWLKDCRQALREEYRAALIACFETELRLGEHERLTPELADLAAADPLDERIAGLLMVAYYRGGRPAQATRLYRSTRERLKTDLGVEPSQQLKELYQRFLNQDPGLDPPGRVTPQGERATVSAVSASRSKKLKGDAGPRSQGPNPDGSDRQVIVGETVADTRRPPSGLPYEPAAFFGRTAELEVLKTALCAMPDGAYTPVVCSISGLAGVGKTALATRVAHALAARFPDGVLFLDMHGYTGGVLPLSPAEALDRLLRRLDVAVPPEPDERAARFRAQVTHRSFLVVLDNVLDAEQIRPLIPPTADTRLLITSRSMLASLDLSCHLSLGPLSQDEGEQLLGGTAGWPAPAGAVADIVRACGRLPLALTIAAARLRTGTTATELRESLASSPDRLEEIQDGERSLAAAFDVSYRGLPEDTRGTFARLGLLPGDDWTADHVMVLDGSGLPAAIRRLERLLSVRLADRGPDGRYRFHDLVAAYARRTAASLPADAMREARRSLSAWAVDMVTQADALIEPHRYRPATEQTGYPAPFADERAAADWLASEHHNLVALCRAAYSWGLDALCWQLAYALRSHFFMTKQWDDWQATHLIALEAARRARDLPAEAMTRNNLGLALMELRHLHAADEHFRAVLALADDHDAEALEYVQANALANHAAVLYYQGNWKDSLRCNEEAWRFYTDRGMERNAAITLRSIGLVEIELELSDEAIGHLSDALATFTGRKLQLNAVMAKNCLGEAYLRRGEPDRAGGWLAEALTDARQCPSRYEEARALRNLGEVALARGEHAAATAHWHAALDLYEQIGAPEAAALSARITGRG